MGSAQIIDINAYRLSKVFGLQVAALAAPYRVNIPQTIIREEFQICRNCNGKGMLRQCNGHYVPLDYEIALASRGQKLPEGVADYICWECAGVGRRVVQLKEEAAR